MSSYDHQIIGKTMQEGYYGPPCAAWPRLPPDEHFEVNTPNRPYTETELTEQIPARYWQGTEPSWALFTGLPTAAQQAQVPGTWLDSTSQFFQNDPEPPQGWIPETEPLHPFPAQQVVPVGSHISTEPLTSTFPTMGDDLTMSTHTSSPIPTSSNRHKPICAQCGKSFTRKWNLKQHFNEVHLSSRPHKCGHCKKAYARRHDLMRHTKKCGNAA